MRARRRAHGSRYPAACSLPLTLPNPHTLALILTQVATGTGIAPYRSFIRRLFVEKTPFAAVRTLARSCMAS